MSVFTILIRPVSQSLVNYVKPFYLLLLLLSLINLSVSIYEDQIGKFDWRQSYVGKIKFSQFDTVSTAKKIIVATEENVIAALNIKTGEIIWRHVLESASSGNIQLLHVSDKVVTVSGDNPYLVRVWDNNSGVLKWEWSITLNDIERAAQSKWWIVKDKLYHLLPVYGSHIEVTSYNVYTGQNREQTSKHLTSWSNKNCIISASHYICISGDYGSKLLISIDVTAQAIQLKTKPTTGLVDWSRSDGILRNVASSSLNIPVFCLDKHLFYIDENSYIEVSVSEAGNYSNVGVVNSQETLVLQIWSDDKHLNLEAKNLKDSSNIDTISGSIDKLDIYEPTISSLMCNRNNNLQYVCRVVVTTPDSTVYLLQQNGQILWSREESLAKIHSVEFIDLPVSELEAAIESEFDQREGDIVGKFVRRVGTQWHQLISYIRDVVGTDDESDSSKDNKLVRDDFDLHKIMFIVTQNGKLFGMDNLSGEILWSQSINFEPISNNCILIRRSARHPPLQALVTVVGRNKQTKNGILVNINPITGALYPDGIIHLDYKIKQLSLLFNHDADFIKPLVLMDSEDSINVIPYSAKALANDMYMFVANRNSTLVEGYALKYDGRSVSPQTTWSLRLDGSKSGFSIVDIATKDPHERVHSPGKVMADRSVLYKYINPNLVAFITEGEDPIHKFLMTVYLVDVVSGTVIWSQQHRRCKLQTKSVHSQNIFTYVYYNDKHRRNEIATVELYEGESRSSEPFSSLSATRNNPQVHRQAYIIPAHVVAITDTVTERGITDKHILASLSSGSIIEFPWSILDPRRPLDTWLAEEGLMQYAPELPMPSDAIISYNRTLERINKIHVAPSGLESTCLVLAHGLDLFYTRVAPSNTFDLLKDDFDYFVIAIVLIGLIIASYTSKYFASKKILKQAWK